MKKLITLLGLSLIMLGACSSTTELSAIMNSGSIQPEGELRFDWGDIDIAGGKVEHIFTLRNSGTDQLVLKGATTSCMCTTATVELPDGSLSPEFGMHTGSSLWVSAVQPGDTFKVRVVFDPMAHGPQGVGPIQRSVYLVSSANPDGTVTKNQANEKRGSVTEIRASGLVLSAEEYASKHTK